MSNLHYLYTNTRMTPQDRFFSEPNLFHRLSEEEIEHNFLLEIQRKVSADSVITIDQIEYEVDCRFSKQRIKLHYSSDLEDIFAVEPDGTLTPIRILNKTENAFIKRKKIHLCRGEESCRITTQDMVWNSIHL